jgi:hypothetical protein
MGSILRHWNCPKRPWPESSGSRLPNVGFTALVGLICMYQGPLAEVAGDPQCARGCGAATSKADSFPRRGQVLHSAWCCNGGLNADVACASFSCAPPVATVVAHH